jgi:hypothetical protein
MHATSPAEWASAASLGLTAIALIGLGLAFADADLAYFDPRPVLGRAGDRFLVHVANARFDAREMAAEARVYIRLSVREAAVSTAALVALLTPSPSESAR